MEYPFNMWELEPTNLFVKLEGWYGKKRPAELAAVLRNLDRYVDLLNAASHARTVQAGFLHGEPSGVVAVDQKGGGGIWRKRGFTRFPMTRPKFCT